MHVLPLPIVSGALEMESAMTSVTVKPRMTGCVLITTLVVLLFSLAIFAQANFGRILGKVSDPSGAVLPGATISIIDTQRGLARTVTTGEAGQYNAPTLIPGTYTVRVEFPGFKTLDRQNVVVEVGKEILVDLTIARQSRNQKGHSPQRRREILLNLLVGCCHRFRRFLKTEYDALNAFSQ